MASVTESGIPIEDLDVIGYADTLPQELLPRLVAPVFRRRSNPKQIVLPPFKFYEGMVVGLFHLAMAIGTEPSLKDRRLELRQFRLRSIISCGSIRISLRAMNLPMTFLCTCAILPRNMFGKQKGP
jgi:hypothetical protein